MQLGGSSNINHRSWATIAYQQSLPSGPTIAFVEDNTEALVEDSEDDKVLRDFQQSQQASIARLATTYFDQQDSLARLSTGST